MSLSFGLHLKYSRPTILALSTLVKRWPGFQQQDRLRAMIAYWAQDWLLD